MVNLLVAPARSKAEARKIVLDPLNPNTVKEGTPPESLDQEQELERFEQKFRGLCDQMALKRGSRPDRIEGTQQAHQEPEERPGPTLTRERDEDRGHER
jgi:hypothetical protein